MCRWLAYTGPSIIIGQVVLRPQHSLLVQSLTATDTDQTTNGDGFGVGWYGEVGTPALYKDTRPAWNDENLRDLVAHTRSSMFLAHVRAATIAPVQRSNCHPFRHGRWLFQHNGHVPQFQQLKRELLFEVSPALFETIEGSTDSEVLFHLALTYGLDEAPYDALARTVGHVEALRARDGIDEPLHFTVAVANGTDLFAVRYASHGPARSLFATQAAKSLSELNPSITLPAGSALVASEPLGSRHVYEEVPASSFLAVTDGRVDTRPFVPQAPGSAAASSSDRVGQGPP